jgi:hypothetical protein
MLVRYKLSSAVAALGDLQRVRIKEAHEGPGPRETKYRRDIAIPAVFEIQPISRCQGIKVRGTCFVLQKRVRVVEQRCMDIYGPRHIPVRRARRHGRRRWNALHLAIQLEQSIAQETSCASSVRLFLGDMIQCDPHQTICSAG